MDDRWFIYFEDGWLYFHRSWTGFSIYALKLDATESGYRVTDSWVSRDPAQYEETDTEQDRHTVCVLIDTLLLGGQDEVEDENGRPAIPALDDEGTELGPELRSNTYPGARQLDLLTFSGLHGHTQVLASADAPARVVAWFEARRGPSTRPDETSWEWKSVSSVGVHMAITVQAIETSHQPAIRGLSSSQRAKYQTVIVEESIIPPRSWWKFW